MAKQTGKRGAAPARHEHDEPVRVHTPAEINERIDREMEIRIQYYATQDDAAIDERIAELEEEADLEHVLEANAATLSLLGLVMGVAFSRKWLLLPIVTGTFLLNHAVRGWCPPVTALRRLGVRTREEIDREKYALLTLRGNMDDVRQRRKSRA